jgi:alanyl-tRNA synthetase
MQQVEEIGGRRVIAVEVADANPKELRGLLDELKQRLGSGIILLATRQGSKATLALGVTSDLTSEWKAGELIKDVATVVGGTGGGRPDFAQAGGPKVDAIPQALERLRDLLSG